MGIDCNVTENYFSEKSRMNNMCMIRCKECPLSMQSTGRDCNTLERNSWKTAIAIVQKWSDEHPLPKPKTYAEDFREKFPNAELSPEGYPVYCREAFYGNKPGCALKCFECWDEPMEEEQLWRA